MPSPILSSITPQSATVGDPNISMVVRGVNLSASSVLQFGGQQMTTVFVDPTQLLVTIPTSAFPNTSLGGLSVNISDQGNVSNSVSFTVTTASPVKITDLQAIANSITMPDVSGLVNESNPYVKPISNVLIYQITQGDMIQGLQGIAQNVTGDATKWDQIAFINNLRYPYISDNPIDLQGKASTTLYLSKRVNIGDTVVYVSGISPFLTEGAILFFTLQSPQTDGTVKLISDIVRVEAVTVDSNTPSNTRILLQQPILNVYPVATSFSVLDTNNNTSSRIVTAGDFILVPTTNSSGNNLQSNQIDLTQVYQLLGQDFWLDNNGLFRNDQNGDIQTIVGISNLYQAICHRLVTEIGELVYHQSYGNPLLKYIGFVNGPVLAALANYEIGNTLTDDPRIRDIKAASVTVRGDTLSVNVVAEVNTFNKVVQLNFNIPVK